MKEGGGEGEGAGTNKSSQESTGMDRNNALHPAPPGDRTQAGSLGLISEALTTELRPPCTCIAWMECNSYTLTLRNDVHVYSLDGM